jgi:uncharacterized protein YuzE
MRVYHDKEADVVFLQLLEDAKEHRTVELVGEPHPVEDWVLGHYDADGRLVSLEFLSLEAFLKHADVAHRGGITADRDKVTV